MTSPDETNPPGSPVCCSPRRAARPTSTPPWPRRPRPDSSCPLASRWPFRAAPSSRRPRRGSFRKRPAGSSGLAWARRCARTSCGATAWTSSGPVHGCATTCSPSRRASRRFAPESSITTASSTTSISLRRSGVRGPLMLPDPKVDIAAVNPWMLRMAGEVADGVHIHPLGEPGYLTRHALPNIAEGAAKAGRSPSDIAVIVPVMTIVGDTDEERAQRTRTRASQHELLRKHTQLRVHLGRGRVRGDDRPDSGEAKGRRLRRHGGPDQRRAHRRLRHRVDLGRLGRRADREVRQQSRLGSCCTTLSAPSAIRSASSGTARWPAEVSGRSTAA